MDCTWPESAGAAQCCSDLHAAYVQEAEGELVPRERGLPEEVLEREGEAPRRRGKHMPADPLKRDRIAAASVFGYSGVNPGRSRSARARIRSLGSSYEDRPKRGLHSAVYMTYFALSSTFFL